MVRRTGVVIGILIIGVATVSVAACQLVAPDDPPEPVAPRRLVDILLAKEGEVVQALLPPRTTLSALLRLHNLIEDEVTALADAVATLVDPRRLRAGQPYRLERRFDGRVRAFLYEVDAERMLLITRQSETAEPRFHASVVPIPKRIEVVTVGAAITRETPSLVQALEEAGERVDLSLALADVFSGEIDFNNDLQPGDTFRLIVERGVREDGTFAGYGPVLAAEFANDDRRLRAVRFAVDEGKPAYYDESGRSLKRFFLKSPLKFEPRVTSSFSRGRRHPILNYTRRHSGVDYAAPTGAPVVAVASGVVVSAGWAGGGGRAVRVRHASGYESEYLHLSSIAAGIRAGARIGQGELVGRVGSTGLATGPHLHYGLRRNGVYVNPVREHHNMPPGDPVPDVRMTAFGAERDRLFGVLGRDAGARAVND
jgi:murein DD-endopeptidase MepM/ murein hydrolase activator NlpD